MGKHKAELIVALDVDSLVKLQVLVDQLDGVVDIYKIGSQVFTSCGPAAVRVIQARGKKVFLDLKFHDIPNTVGNAVRSAINLSEAVERTMDSKHKGTPSETSLFMYTLHTLGGLEMLKRAVQSGTEEAGKNKVTVPLAVGVTVLTSEEKKDNIQNLVLERASLAKQAGLSGVVASVQETSLIRKKFGKDFVIVTPGIRPSGAQAGDQKRIATPAEAIKAGSNFLVVGRPIVAAENPKEAAQRILDEMNNA